MIRWHPVMALCVGLMASLRFAAQSPAPPILPISDLDHLSLHVSDVRRSSEFYTALFGSEVSRDPNRQANPGSVAGELWFIRLGDTHLSLSPLPPGERPGLDHFCFAVQGFDRETMQGRLVGFVQPWRDWPNGLWITDPAGHIIQLAASTSAPRLPTIVRNAVVVPSERPRQPLSQPLRITHLTVTGGNVSELQAHYQKLLGDGAEEPSGFRVGPSRLRIQPPSALPSFRVGIAGYAANAVRTKLSGLTIASHMVEDGSAVEFLDPDGLVVQIGPS